MTTEHLEMEVRGIPVEVIRKDIKNLHLGVYPPDGKVRVSAPRRLGDEAIRLAIVSRIGWIHRKRRGFVEQVRQSQRELVTGESQYFLGRRYRLRVTEAYGRPSVALANNTTMLLRVPPIFCRDAREAFLQKWYRQRLYEAIPPLTRKWERKANVTIAEVRIKRMRTLWGSCNATARRIWLNLELVKKPLSCIEYVFVHEIAHLTCRRHDEQFVARMNELIPQWRTYRDELNRAPLAHKDWSY